MRHRGAEVVEPLVIAVVGGSLGGLTGALLLRDLGHRVDVYERSTAELEARGAGIAVLDETVRYLRERTELSVDAVCTATDVIRYLDGAGRTVHESRHRYRFSSWNTIYRELLACFGAERYHLGAELVTFEQRADEVVLRLADGTTRTCDLLVCADGIASSARGRLLPEVAPEYAGYVAWRGTVPEPQLTAPSYQRLHDAITYQVLPGSHILVYPIPSPDGELAAGCRLANFVWYRNYADDGPLEDLLLDRHGRAHRTSLPPGAARDQHLEEMRGFAREHLAPPIAEVVAAAAAPFVQVVYDIAVPRMAFGRTVLLGDAAFAVRPHAAAGTAKAAADAWALANALERHAALPAALADFERAQLGLGAELLARARRIGERSQVHDTWEPGDPELIFGLRAPGA